MTMNFADFVAAESAGRCFEANRILFKWLSDDGDRAALYAHLRSNGMPVLQFQSRADKKLGPADASEFHQDVFLLTGRAEIEFALTDTTAFSNFPYQALGSGTFMLGLDSGDHKPQRDFASAYLRHIGTIPGKGRGDPVTDDAFDAYLRDIASPLRASNPLAQTDQAFEGYRRHVDAQTISALSALAFMAAAVLPLKQRRFDLADLAEQAALRFAGFLFGFAQADHPLIEATMRAAYLGLNYQILGRHFVSEPAILPNSTIGMGALLQRVADLIDLYSAQIGQEQEDEFKAIADELKEVQAYKDRSGKQALVNFVPLLQRIAGHAEPNAATQYSGTELAVMVVGMIAGTIGNVQASVAIAMSEFFQDPRVFQLARDAAYRSRADDPAACGELQSLIWEALRLNPPVAFLPRKTIKAITLGGVAIPQDRVVILAMGGATRDPRNNPDGFDENRKLNDPLIFGGPPGPAGFIHQCIGQHLAMPLITHVVRQVLVLPGLTQCLDPRTAQPMHLEKLWGFNCRKLPLEYNRYELLRQSPLNVIMQVKTPVSEHAEALKKVIKYGAPRIEKKLRDARHVHFAWFEFIENDTKLVLHTVYDRDFDAYIEHFALEIGPLFDLLFEHIQDAPPRPVNKFPKEFIDTVRRYNAPPAGDYFFSAYSRLEATMVTNQFRQEDA